MAFQFGAPNQTTTQPGSTGFTLSQPQQQQAKAFTGAFNFASSAAPSSGFAFGTPVTTAAATGLGFGAPASTPATQGFSFGTPAAAPGGGFSFGQTASTTASSAGFGFGPQASTTTATATTAPSGFMFGTPSTSVGSTGGGGFNFGGGGGAPVAAATTTSSVFSFTPSSTFSGFGTPTTTTASTNVFGFGMGNVSSTTTAPGGFSLVNTQPSSSTSSAFTFGTPKTTASVIAPAFGFGAPNTAQASTTTVASNTTGALPFSASSFGGTGFAFTTKPAATTATTGFAFAAPTTATGTSIFAPSQMTSASVLNPPGPFNQGTTTTATMSSATTSALGTNLGSVPTGGSSFGLNVPSVTSFGNTTQPATGTAVNFMSSEAPKSTAFAFPLSTSTSSSTGTTSGFGGTVLTSSATVIKPTLNFTAPATTVVASVAPSMPISSQADQAKIPSLTTTAPAIVSSSVSSGFGFPSSTTSVTTSSTGFPTLGSSLKLATTTSGPSLLSTTSPFSSSTGTFGSFGTTTSVSLSTATTVTASSAAGAALTTTTTVTPASAAPPATMNFRQLEDTINKWKIELEEQERVFLNQATQVNAWDRLLISNGEKITELNEAVERVKLDQQRLDHELDFILAQQRELEELLVPLEKSVEATPNIHHQQHADLEREHTYHLAENIDAQLKRMAEDIKEIIEHLNSSNKTQDDNDPIQQIAKILNAHMDALQWVDQNTAVLRRKLDETSKLYESHRRDHEKSFRVGFN